MSTYKRLLYEATQARDMYEQCAQFSTHTEHCLGTCFQNIMTPGLHLCLPCPITASFPRCRVIPLALFSHGVIHFLPFPPVSYGVVDRSAERLWPWDLVYESKLARELRIHFPSCAMISGFRDFTWHFGPHLSSLAFLAPETREMASLVLVSCANYCDYCISLGFAILVLSSWLLIKSWKY